MTQDTANPALADSFIELRGFAELPLYAQREQASRAVARLRAQYPDAGQELSGLSPWELSVTAVLLGQCSLAYAVEVMRGVLAAWPTPARLGAAKLADVMLALQGAPLRAFKAETLVALGAMLTKDHEGLVPLRLTELRSLPGLDPWRAQLISGFGFGEQTVIVDGHVTRVMERLGWLSGGDPVSRLEDLLPAMQWRDGSMALSLHGHKTCTLARPGCDACPFTSCPSRAGRLPE